MATNNQPNEEDDRQAAILYAVDSEPFGRLHEDDLERMLPEPMRVPVLWPLVNRMVKEGQLVRHYRETDVFLSRPDAPKPAHEIPADYLFVQGRRYPVADYLTVTAYAQKYGLNLRTLISRVERGSLPDGALVEVPAWNLRLIRDQPYPVAPRGPKPKPEKLKNVLEPRHQVVPSVNGQWHLQDKQTGEVIYSVEANSKDEAIDAFNRDGHSVDQTGAIVGLFL